MIQLPKKLAFFIFILVTVLLAISFYNLDWSILNSNHSIQDIFKEMREPLIFLLLVIYFLNYYVNTLKKEEK